MKKQGTFFFCVGEKIFKMIKAGIGNFLKQFFLKNKIKRRKHYIPQNNSLQKGEDTFCKLIKENELLCPWQWCTSRQRLHGIVQRGLKWE